MFAFNGNFHEISFYVIDAAVAVAVANDVVFVVITISDA